MTLLVAFVSIMRMVRAKNRRRGLLAEVRCSCGYLLEKLEVPRCPECGCLVGFRDVKLADLGLNEEQVRAYRENRKRELVARAE